MNHEHGIDLKDMPPEVLALLGSLTLKALKSIEASGMDQVLCRFDRLERLVLASAAEEMRNVDKETNDISRSIDRLTKKLGDSNPELVSELTSLARNLEPIGKQIKTLGSTVDPLTP